MPVAYVLWQKDRHPLWRSDRMKLRCHLCLVSDQPTPNITPVLDASFKPQQVILLTSPEKQQQAERLKQAMQPSGVRVSLWPIDDAMDID